MANVYWFTPPTRLEKRGQDRLFGRMNAHQGETIVKRDGIYSVAGFRAGDDDATAQEVYVGGHIYLLTEEQATGLTDAGYGEFITQADSYGSGPYGAGDYS